MRLLPAAACCLALLAALPAAPARAQSNDQGGAQAGATSPGSSAPATPPANGTPAAPASPSTGTPNLAVATVKLEGGTRVSRIIGAAVWNDQNERVGTVDDLIVTGQDKLTLAVIQVGGFLSLGGKLVAVPYAQLRFSGDQDHRIVMPGATKDALNAMPNFTYGG